MDRMDSQFLERFLASGDESAFEALVKRYGSLVYGVCRRMLSNTHDAEDAFQATFLVLARRASAVRGVSALGPWLYTVATRVALRARASAARQKQKERAMPAAEPHDESGWEELRPILDRELDKLPEKYRAPVVLCYFQGLTQEDAARELGWTKGTVSGRLARAKEILRGRLERSGVKLSAALLGTLIGQHATAVAVPSALVGHTVQTVSLIAQGGLAQASLATPQVVNLSEGVIQMMLWSKLKVAAAVLAVVLVGGGTGWFWQGVQAAEEAPVTSEVPEAPALTQAAFDALFAKLQGEDPDSREAAEKALRSQGALAKPYLEKMTEQSDETARIAARRILGLIETQPIVDRIAETLKRVETYSGRMKSEGEVMGMAVNSEGTFKGRCLTGESVSEMKSQMMGQNIVVRTVMDGKTAWALTTINNGPQVVYKTSGELCKQITGQENSKGQESPMEIVGTFLRDYEFTSLEESLLEDQPVYVLKGTYKNGVYENRMAAMKKLAPAGGAQVDLQMEMMRSPVVYLDRATLMIRRFEYTGKDGKPSLTTTFSDLVLNPPLADSLFVFNLPEGATVIDVGDMLAKMQQHEANTNQPQDAVAVPPAAPPKEDF